MVFQAWGLQPFDYLKKKKTTPKASSLIGHMLALHIHMSPLRGRGYALKRYPSAAGKIIVAKL